MSDITRPEFDARMAQLEASLDRHADRIVERLDAINGRVRLTESRVAVLEDRDDRSDQVARAGGAWSGSKWGAGIAALVSGLMTFFLGGD